VLLPNSLSDSFYSHPSKTRRRPRRPRKDQRNQPDPLALPVKPKQQAQMANAGQPLRNNTNIPPQPTLSTTITSAPGTAESRRWSDVTASASNLEKLRFLCHSRRERQKEGYVLDDLTHSELIAKQRCSRCHGKSSLMLQINDLTDNTSAVQGA
jgi:hypothetical protein